MKKTPRTIKTKIPVKLLPPEIVESMLAGPKKDRYLTMTVGQLKDIAQCCKPVKGKVAAEFINFLTELYHSLPAQTPTGDKIIVEI